MDDNDDMDDYDLAMTSEGAAMMAVALNKAMDLGILDIRYLTMNNLSEFVNTLADIQELWEDSALSNLSDRDQRILMLAIALLRFVKRNGSGGLN